jgi:hypothetical protein
MGLTVRLQEASGVVEVGAGVVVKVVALARDGGDVRDDVPVVTAKQALELVVLSFVAIQRGWVNLPVVHVGVLIQLGQGPGVQRHASLGLHWLRHGQGRSSEGSSEEEELHFEIGLVWGV